MVISMHHIYNVLNVLSLLVWLVLFVCPTLSNDPTVICFICYKPEMLFRLFFRITIFGIMAESLGHSEELSVFLGRLADRLSM